MIVHQGSSTLTDAAQAVEQATASWPATASPQLVIAFSSTAQDPQTLASALYARWPAATVIGCSTAGEHLSGQHFNGALVLMGVESSQLRWEAALIPDVLACDEAQARQVVDELMARHGLDRDAFSTRDLFALLLIDGLAMREEQVTAHIADALDGIPLLGGSAGDDLRFERTFVLHQGRAHQGAAVLILGRSQVPFTLIKHQHFTTTSPSLAITRADVAARRVYEMDGYPAAQAYARALGVARHELTDALTFMHPLIFPCEGQLYVRSIMKIHEEDDSISFYCGIEEGMVLRVAGHEDMADALERALEGVQAELIIGFNCILRALEAGQRQQHEIICQAMARHARHVIAFDTYGEQLNGLHINQTFVALALHASA